MRGIVLVMACVLLSGCSGAPTDKQRQAFDQADEAFVNAETAEEYLKVAGAYQQLVNDGVRSSSVLFNQGNAFMRAEQPGRAIACYRQALRISPTNPSIRNNLGIALAKVGGQNRSSDWFRRFVFWHDWVGYGQKYWLATIVILIALVVLLMARWKRSDFGTRVGIFVAAVAAICVASAAYDWLRFSAEDNGVVAVKEAIARTGNGESYDDAFNQPLSEGTEFRVLERRGDWLRVVVDSAGEAWLPDDAVVVY